MLSASECVCVCVCKRMFISAASERFFRLNEKNQTRKRFLWALQNTRLCVRIVHLMLMFHQVYVNMCFFLPFVVVVSPLFTDGIGNEHRTTRPRGTWYTQDHTMQTRFQRLLGKCLLLLLRLPSLSLSCSYSLTLVPSLLSLPQHTYPRIHTHTDAVFLIAHKSIPKTCWAQAQTSTGISILHTIVCATASLCWCFSSQQRIPCLSWWGKANSCRRNEIQSSLNVWSEAMYRFACSSSNNNNNNIKD